MAKRHLSVSEATTGPDHAGPLVERFAALREELGLSTAYPDDALAEAQQALTSATLPERDETAVPFYTVDPPGSMDLDQAIHLEREGDGFHVRYAIADVPVFVRPGGALDAETRRRGQTFYMPDLRVPLHPPVLSEDGGSLLPRQVRPAYVWDLRLDGDGEVVSAEVYRARVRSTDRYDYAQVQRAVDDGTADERVALLKEVGEVRIELERARGGASLPMPEQEVGEHDGHYRIEMRPVVPAEDWNAQLSLMTGMAAAEMMLHAQVGILRTMPAADHDALQRFHRQAAGLGIPWAAEQPYGEFLRSLDRYDPRHLALIHAATALFRGAGYTPFDGDVPEQAEQAAVAAPYAHVTAPLRRLVDRFGLVICAAVSAGEPVPDWVRQALPTLPDAMRASDQLAGKVERACADAVEAAVLSDSVGRTTTGSVVDERDGGVLVQLHDLPVLAPAKGEAELGEDVEVRVVSAEIASGTVVLEIV